MFARRRGARAARLAAAADVPILGAPFDGPFGRTFTFADLDGCAVTSPDRS